jgi:hypothetical protein
MFINGTPYAGKSTMVRMLADEYGLLHCGENYNCIPEGFVTPEEYPNLGYFQTKKDWQEFFGRTPEEYDNWIQGNTEELIEFEISYLMTVASSQRVIVDTNLPSYILHEIAEYNQVAVMLAPPSISIDYFFDRNDDKPWIKEQLMKMDDPEKGMANFRAILERICSQKYYDEWAESGFFTVVRKDVINDTRLETMNILANHFGLKKD